MKTMTYRASRWAFGVAVAVSSLGIVSDAAAGDERQLVGPATSEEVAALVRDLGDRSFEVRTFATRRLCAIGRAAYEPLHTAAEGSDVETALRAKRVLAVLDTLWFSDVELSLAFSESKIGWDEPVNLEISITNQSAFPARVPFDLKAAAGSSARDDARQVADMLDAAEWLSVRGPDGSPVELRVDEISGAPEVLAQVQARLNGGPSGVVLPGERVKVVAHLFNRGWARFPLLDRGRFTAVLDYIPQWQDEALAEARVGRVRSNTAEVTVTRAAPETVSRSGVEPEITIVREGRSLVARLTNGSDLPAHVNTNFGDSLPFAEGRWIHELDGSTHEVQVSAKVGASWWDFDESRLTEVAAGAAIELARVEIAELRRALADLGAEVSGGRWKISFSYANYCDRYWQARQGDALLGNERAPAILREPLPRRLLTTRRTSNKLTAPGVE